MTTRTSGSWLPKIQSWKPERSGRRNASDASSAIRGSRVSPTPLANGADPNIRNEAGATALMWGVADPGSDSEARRLCSGRTRKKHSVIAEN